MVYHSLQSCEYGCDIIEEIARNNSWELPPFEADVLTLWIKLFCPPSDENKALGAAWPNQVNAKITHLKRDPQWFVDCVKGVAENLPDFLAENEKDFEFAYMDVQEVVSNAMYNDPGKQGYLSSHMARLWAALGMSENPSSTSYGRRNKAKIDKSLWEDWQHIKEMGSGVRNFLLRRPYWGKRPNCEEFCKKITTALRQAGFKEYGEWTALDLSLSFCCCEKLLDGVPLPSTGVTPRKKDLGGTPLVNKKG